MSRFFRAFVLVGIIFPTFLAVQAKAADVVTIVNASPSNGAQVDDQFTASAEANCTESGCHITGWYVYIDTLPVYHNPGTSLDADIDVSKYSDGNHSLIYKAWDNFGTIGVYSAEINIQNGGSAGITITSPTSNEQVNGEVNVAANLSEGKEIAQIQVYDNGVKIDFIDITPSYTATLNKNYNLAAGNHTTTVLDLDTSYQEISHSQVSYTVTGGGSGGPWMPTTGVTKISDIETLTNWGGRSDGGGSWGSTGFANNMRSFFMCQGGDQCGGNGPNGYLFYDDFGADATANNFIYETSVYIDDPSTMGNLEMDLNQVLDANHVMIFGIQCDRWKRQGGSWDYTANLPVYGDTWVPSKYDCDPRTLPAKSWIHFELSYCRDDSGNILYQQVWVNGKPSDINEKVYSEFNLKWAPGRLINNFQLNATSSVQTQVQHMNNYRWTGTCEMH